MSSMSRPEVTPENYEAVYEYYSKHEPSKLALKGLHVVMSHVYRPRVRYASGAEERIGKLLDTDHRLFIACNHINMLDQLAVASAMWSGPLRPTTGHTIALAKQPYFKNAVSEPRHLPFLVNPVIRRSLDAVGAIPVYREKDSTGMDRRERLRVGRLLFDTVANQVEAGKHVFLFPEGTRNRDRENLHRLGRIQSGIGHMVVESARRDVPVAMVPMALWYGDGESHSFRPDLFVGEPVEGPFESAKIATEALSKAMAFSLEQARQPVAD